ncbi:hypothetical protein [Hymenobacter canadensis]|uniref:Uncharacterized protein n=1 Tax=Hymenobacter canadensis TaxID=2999067 RepID=A0ABY7LUS9_9BACT|nr:hypothetical protein [Hymenobacter canadensis]WBA44148.1 hypothetical protein O3303_19860 [Hymenobacter canadensis]
MMALSEQEVFGTISPILQEYSKRHRSITRVLGRNCARLQPLFAGLGLDFEK